jgi:imidazolonepropionase-like amidohydrolase
VHVGSSENAINAIKAGADVLAHGIYRGKLSEEDAKFIAESKIPIIYTLFVFELSAQLTEGIYNPTQFDSLLLDQKILKGITTNQALQIKNYPVIHAITSNLVNERENWRSNLDLLRKYGAKIIVGTDSGTPGLGHGTAIYHEIDELLKYGLTNYEVLRAATYLSSSTYMDKPSFGFLNEGFEADMLLLNNNPLQEINAVKYPSLIFTNGLIFKRN